MGAQTGTPSVFPLYITSTSYSSLAQSVEHLTVNQGVTGSSPVGGAIPMLQKGNSQKDHNILWPFCYSKTVFLNILCMAVQKSLALI